MALGALGPQGAFVVTLQASGSLASGGHLTASLLSWALLQQLRPHQPPSRLQSCPSGPPANSQHDLKYRRHHIAYLLRVLCDSH